MTTRWPLVFFHNIIDVSSYNAFVMWNKINPTWMADKQNKRRVFLEQLGKALVTHTIKEGSRSPAQQALQSLRQLFRGLNLVLIHLRLQLGQARGGAANSAPQRRTVLCSVKLSLDPD